MRDIRVNPDYIDELIKLGAHATPTFIIGDEIVYGYHPDQIKEAWKNYQTT